MSSRALKTGELLVPQTFTIQADNATGDITDGCAPFQVHTTLTDKPKAKNEKKAKPEPMDQDKDDDSSYSSEEEDNPEDAFMLSLPRRPTTASRQFWSTSLKANCPNK